MLGTCFFRLLYNGFQVRNCIIEEVECKVDKAAQVEYLIVFRRVLKALIEITLGIFEHLGLSLWLDGLVHSVSYYGYGAE